VNNENTALDMSQLVPISQRYRQMMFTLMHDRGMTWSGGDISRMIDDTPSLGAPESIVLAVRVLVVSLYHVVLTRIMSFRLAGTNNLLLRHDPYQKLR
jgi:hypothetical protein